MDAKITKNRLAKLLTYDWIKIIAVVAAFILGWSVLLNSTRADIRPSQRFTVMSYYSNDELGSDFSSLFNNARHKDSVFSYETAEIDAIDLTKTEKNSIVDYLDSRFATAQGDIMFAPSIPYTGTDADGDLAFERTFVENFFNRFYDNVYKLEEGVTNEYFGGLESYLNGFYDNGYLDENSLNETKVERNFRQRINEYNDKRYRKESLIKAALPSEIERIKKYRDALVEFNSYLDAGVIEIVTMNIKDDKGNILWTGKSAINLCPDESKMGNLEKYISYTATVEYTDEETGETLTKKDKTAKDMYAMFIYSKKLEPGYQYESLLFLNYLIKNSLTVVI